VAQRYVLAFELRRREVVGLSAAVALKLWSIFGAVKRQGEDEWMLV
jgi:hypothetical protein